MSDVILIREQRRFVVTGKVQGVAFLLWLRNVAQSLELAGSVRALPDGRVEAIVQGDKQLVKQFAIACKRGPAEAEVMSVEQESEPLDPRLSSFVVYR